MEFRVLGPLEVWNEGSLLPVKRPKELCLLAVLLLHANEVVAVERLIDELWPFDPPAKPLEAVQELVYQLRKTIEGSRARGSILERQGDGYRLVVARDDLDLHRFERLVEAAAEARRKGDLDSVSWTLREALGIWRGLPLANVAFESLTSTRADVERLRELRLNVLAQRIEIDLELGQEGEVVGELEALIAENRLDERLRALLMLALYRAGRQADALALYRETRATLLDELGIEPGRQLQHLHQAILRQDPELDPAAIEIAGGRSGGTDALGRAIVVCGANEIELGALLGLAEPLGRSQLARDLILAVVVAPGESALADANALAQQRRTQLLAREVGVRAAAFTSTSPADDIVRLASREDVDLLLLPAPEIHEDGLLSAEAVAVLANAPCDVGLLSPRDQAQVGPVAVPFGALEHDWAALEVGAWIATAMEAPLRLLGTRGRPEDSTRDASRLLADASLLVQQFLGIAADLHLMDSGPEAFLHESDGAGLLVLGLPDRWRQEGVGSLRATLVRDVRPPVLLIRKGARPGGLAPRDSATVFAWSFLDSASAGELVSAER